MVAQQKIINGFYAVLFSAIGDLVGNRIFYKEGPQDETLPLCVFQIISDTPEYLFAAEIENVNIQVNFFGELDNGINTTTAISDALTAYVGERSNKVVTDEKDFSVRVINKGTINIIANDIDIMQEFLLV